MDISKDVKVPGRILASSVFIPVAEARITRWQAGANGRWFRSARDTLGRTTLTK